MTKLTLDGQEYELVILKGPTIDGKQAFGLKPTKAVEKNATYLEFVWGRKKLLEDYSGQYTLPTAQKVAAAIEALMEYVTADKFPSSYNKICETADEAFKAFQEDA